MNDANLPNDKLHDSALSSLYQQSKLDEPPMALDSAVLTRARKAVERKSPARFLLKWLVPAASTAMILLAVTITYQNRDKAVVHETDVVASMNKPASKPAQAPMLAKEQTVKNESRMMQLAQPMEEKTVPTESKAKVMNKMAAPEPAKADLGMSAEPEMAMDEALEMSKPIEMNDTMRAAPPAVRSKKMASKADEAAMGSVAENFSAADEVAELSAEIKTPEAWLKEIEKLVEQGKAEEAREEFKAFRKQFPDYKVEEELLKRLSIEY